MIVENSVTIYKLLRPYWHLIPAVLVILATVEIANDYARFDRPAFSLATMGLLVTALSVFLAFRVNEAYTRWWEARILWGDLMNASRAFSRKATTLVGLGASAETPPDEILAFRRELVYRQIAFVNALRLSLRRENRWEELKPFIDDEEFALLMKAPNKPTQILQRQGERLADACARGWLSDNSQSQLDRTFSDLHCSQGGCERIKHTPFPQNIAYATRAVAWVMAIVVPVAITDPSNRFELVDMVVVPFLMLSFLLIERLGAELRNPFENEPNDIPMTALCRTIERDLRCSLGETPLPPEIEPKDTVLD